MPSFPPMKRRCALCGIPLGGRELAGSPSRRPSVFLLLRQKKGTVDPATRRSRSIASQWTPLRCSAERLGCGTRPFLALRARTELRQSSPSRFAGTPFLLRYSALSTGPALECRAGMDCRLRGNYAFDGGTVLRSLSFARRREPCGDESRLSECQSVEWRYRPPPPHPSPASRGGSPVVTCSATSS